MITLIATRRGQVTKGRRLICSGEHVYLPPHCHRRDERGRGQGNPYITRRSSPTQPITHPPPHHVVYPGEQARGSSGHVRSSDAAAERAEREAPREPALAIPRLRTSPDLSLISAATRPSLRSSRPSSALQVDRGRSRPDACWFVHRCGPAMWTGG